jgi:hypothetical protein
MNKEELNLWTQYADKHRKSESLDYHELGHLLRIAWNLHLRILRLRYDQPNRKLRK